MKGFSIFLIILSGVFLFFSGFFLGRVGSGQDLFHISRTQNSGLTNPLLDCEIYESGTLTKTNTIKRNITRFLNNNKQGVSDVSVYFRDLNNGPSFGIAEKDKFAPASLLKVPLMIAWLKEYEKNPKILDKKILFTQAKLLDNNLSDDASLKPGSTYTADELIYRMIAHSDNLAFETLLDNINPATVKNVHKDLDLVYPDNKTPEDYVSVKSYAGLFRVLYNSTYLEQTASEKALEYLKKSDFKEGIKAGIPANITTALKYGVRDLDRDGLVQIHDCGIVYKPGKPYLLCIMTKGNNPKQLIEMIKGISALIYKSI